MFNVLIAMLLFSLTHPGAAYLIKSSHISVFAFTLLFLFWRVVVQIPLFVHYRDSFALIKSQWLFLVMVGLCGSSVHYLEFAALNTRLPISVISFLVFVHPIWSFLFRYVLFKQKPTINDTIKLIVGISGIFLIIDPATTGVRVNFDLLFPLGASFVMSLWFNLNQIARDRGINRFTFSFAYDAIGLIGISLFVLSTSGLNTFTEASSWTTNIHNFLPLLAYSVIIGFLPNLFLFDGIAKVGALSASYLLLLEPVVSSTISKQLFNEVSAPTFYMGAALIVLINLPHFDKLLNRIFTRIKAHRFQEKGTYGSLSDSTK